MMRSRSAFGRPRSEIAATLAGHRSMSRPPAISIWLIGQAKHYPEGCVGPAEVRELVGAILLSRHREYTIKDVYPDLSVHSCAPVVGLFVTSGRFTSGGRRVAEASGIVCKDGHQLASFLADHSRGLVPHGGGLAFSAEEFTLWLRQLPQK